MQIINPDYQIQAISNTLFEVYDFFTPEIRSWLLSQYHAGHDWQFDIGSARRLVRVLPRQGLGLQIIQATEQMLSAWQGKPMANQSAKLFFDTRGYRTGAHYDDAEIEIMLQIYLDSDYLGTPGTIFYVEQTYQTAFRPNSGYININSDLKWHESATVVHGVRKSFVGSYARIDKSR
jgi:hypothetical protein